MKGKRAVESKRLSRKTRLSPFLFDLRRSASSADEFLRPVPPGNDARQDRARPGRGEGGRRDGMHTEASAYEQGRGAGATRGDLRPEAGAPRERWPLPPEVRAEILKSAVELRTARGDNGEL